MPAGNYLRDSDVFIKVRDETLKILSETSIADIIEKEGSLALSL
jgi:hypothetical protein